MRIEAEFYLDAEDAKRLEEYERFLNDRRAKDESKPVDRNVLIGDLFRFGLHEAYRINILEK